MVPTPQKPPPSANFVLRKRGSQGKLDATIATSGQPGSSTASPSLGQGPLPLSDFCPVKRLHTMSNSSAGSSREMTCNSIASSSPADDMSTAQHARHGFAAAMAGVVSHTLHGAATGVTRLGDGIAHGAQTLTEGELPFL
eukprot:4279542-Pleurochrysis_carterae.AAC.3